MSIIREYLNQLKTLIKKGSVIIVLSAFFTATIVGFLYHSNTFAVENTVVVREDVTEEVDRLVGEKLEAKKLELQNDILAELAQCETGGIEEQDATIILDTNGKMSIGRYQWQIDSLIDTHKRYLNEDINRVQAIHIATTHEDATEHTRYMLFEVENGWQHWRNCSNIHGLPKKIEFVNGLVATIE